MTAASPTPALEVTDLQVAFSHPRPAVRSIGLRVDRGEIVALVGESGSGKSITARAAMGLLPPTATAAGSVKVDGVEVLGASERELDAVRGGRVAMIFQEPQTALNPVRTVGWLIGEALRAHGHAGRKRLRERAVELLTLVEIPEPAKRVDYYPHQLSGGQKQRVVIALALANDPVLLLADEPTTALDVTVQAEILALLRRLRDRTNAGILLITHNLGVVADIADSVVVLQLGEVVERGEVTEIFARPGHGYTRHLLDSVLRLPQPTEVAEPATGVAETSTPVLDVDTVSVVYPGRRGQAAFRALDAVSLRLAAGEVLGVVGESGSGKTTLGRTIAGLIAPATGTIRVDGRDVAATRGAALRELRRRLAFVPQDPAASLDPRFTLEESIAEPLDIHRVGTRAERRKKVTDLLEAVRLPASFATRLPSELSGGQRQRVALARALVLEPTLLIADEPTSALDVSVQADVLELFATLQRELGFAAVFISHDLAVVERVSTTVAVLRAGQLVEIGPATSVLTHPQHDYTRRLVAALPIPDPVAQRARRQQAATV
ncbi:ABC transporter ATP-binding protein [Rhodococcus pseudokoreensis]|uniref:ABC transporter ATP-binding protein n=1 Tax=Rhodococcus pseudokoreensis TaxID=2811421 RepID=A0A974ZW41_9NOCA|nr:ABC transporter ATP-binding protein [Rhodococcus pseudokoreensis]QSE92201.1 ABC transporter ATP-binding protein [Rhodococcus pseudokoreensis]